MLLLPSKANSLAEVAELLDIHWNTVSRLLDKWGSCESEDKLSTLYSVAGQGAKVKLEPAADILPDLMERHSRNLKSILEKEY